MADAGYAWAPSPRLRLDWSSLNSTSSAQCRLFSIALAAPAKAFAVKSRDDQTGSVEQGNGGVRLTSSLLGNPLLERDHPVDELVTLYLGGNGRQIRVSSLEGGGHFAVDTAWRHRH